MSSSRAYCRCFCFLKQDSWCKETHAVHLMRLVTAEEQRQSGANLYDELLLIHNLHAESKKVAGLGVVVTGCIIALKCVVVEELLGIVLGRDGKVRGCIVDQGV